MLAFSYLLVVVSFAGGLWSLQDNSINAAKVAERRDSAKLFAASSRSCHRVNALRAQADNNSFVVWGALDASRANEIRLYRTSLRSTGNVSHASAKAHLVAARALEGYASQMRWTKLTDCRLAVMRPLTYEPPAPLRFTRSYKPIRG